MNKCNYIIFSKNTPMENVNGTIGIVCFKNGSKVLHARVNPSDDFLENGCINILLAFY